MMPVISRHSFNAVQQGLSHFQKAFIASSTLIKGSGCKQLHRSGRYPEELQGQENLTAVSCSSSIQRNASPEKSPNH